jgi:N-acetyl-alpha-D-muramate 1-phosphate uridylyltransferase
MARTMILAAGRGERMRPMSDACPKPLLKAGGKELIAWQIERLVAAGFGDIVINIAHHAAQLESVLGSGARFGATLSYSRESDPLEVAGGIATALPLLGGGVALVVSADVYTDYDYAGLRARLAAMEASREPPHAHMVMVPNPAYHPDGDFVLRDGSLALDGGPRLTFGNIALYRTSLFRELPRREKLKILPHYRRWIGERWVSGELFTGGWSNVGTPDDLVRLDDSLQRSLH